VIQIEKFVPNQAAISGEFLDHHTKRPICSMPDPIEPAAPEQALGRS
jgi:hypothetical protein